MSDKLQFAVQSRTKLGRQSNAVRRAGLVPGNISDGKVARAIAVDPKSFLSLFDKVGETGLFYVKVDAEQELVPVLVDSVQQHSVDNHLIHVALRQVNLTQKVTADIPIELQGVLAVKEAVALLVRNTVEVEALPLDLPEKFVIDISTLKAIGESITLGQLPHDKAKVTLRVQTDQLATPVVLVQEVKEEKVEEPVVTVAGEAAAATTEGAVAPASEAGATTPAADKTAEKPAAK